MYPYIVADIGGTNARFALVTEKQGDRYVIENVNILQGANYARLEDALAAYIDGLAGIKPKAACIAIAGPVKGDLISMTNLAWSFSKEKVRTQFGLDAFEVLNDFGALAVATSRLTDDHLITVKEGVRVDPANKAILGPGTGLGVAGLASNGANWLPIPSEGGHVNIAPASVEECEVIKASIARLGHVSAEAFLSGPGLVNLYTAVSDVNGRKAQCFEPKDVSAKGLDGSNEDCVAALKHFCAFLGTVSGNLALTYGALGGVYIAGGIVPRLIDFLKDSDFAERFSNKGIMSHYVKDIPVELISFDQTAYLGAAGWLEQVLND
ncbi:MAG: glucokinase [Flavobacteriales bacterium]|jgi:glucokinase